MPFDSDPFLEDVLPRALDGRDGPARRISAEELDAAAQAAVDRTFPGRRRRARTKLSLGLAAAALCTAGISAALLMARPWSGSAPLAPAAVHSRARAAQAMPRGSVNPPGSSSPSSEAVLRGQLQRGESGPAASGPVTSAADLLRTANQLRGQGRWTEAERAYAQVATSHANTTQGPIAALAAASLRLEHLGDPQGALRLYQAALRSSSLSAEAELGIANAYRALGDRDGEIAALRRLVSAHPEAMFHQRATTRLRALEAGKR